MIDGPIKGYYIAQPSSIYVRRPINQPIFVLPRRNHNYDNYWKYGHNAVGLFVPSGNTDTDKLRYVSPQGTVTAVPDSGWLKNYADSLVYNNMIREKYAKYSSPSDIVIKRQDGGTIPGYYERILNILNNVPGVSEEVKKKAAQLGIKQVNGKYVFPKHQKVNRKTITVKNLNVEQPDALKLRTDASGNFLRTSGGGTNLTDMRGREYHRRLERNAKLIQEAEKQGLAPVFDEAGNIIDFDISSVAWRRNDRPLSGADPIGSFAVGWVALNPAFKLAGRAIQYPLARMGNQTARNAIMARKFGYAADRAFGFNGTKPVSSLGSGLIYEGEKPRTSLVIKPTSSEIPTPRWQGFEYTLKNQPKEVMRKPKISLEERKGIPKVLRNQKEKPKSGAENYIRENAIASKLKYPAPSIGERGTLFEDGRWIEDVVPLDEALERQARWAEDGFVINTQPRTHPRYFSSQDPYRAARIKLATKLYNDRKYLFLGDDLPESFMKEVETLRAQNYPINPAFKNNTDGASIINAFNKDLKRVEKVVRRSDFPSYFAQQYRKKLSHLGYDTESLTDDDLLRIISKEYDDITAKMTGKTKGMVFWHGSPNGYRINGFDMSKTGANTGNMGAMGPGNYFSSAANGYGEFEEPFLIDGIKSTPFGNQAMIEKGLIPEYVSPSMNVEGGYKQMMQRLIEKTPNNENMLWIDPANTTVHPRSLDFTNSLIPGEFMLRRNTGIYPIFRIPQ